MLLLSFSSAPVPNEQCVISENNKRRRGGGKYQARARGQTNSPGIDTSDKRYSGKWAAAPRAGARPLFTHAKETEQQTLRLHFSTREFVTSKGDERSRA